MKLPRKRWLAVAAIVAALVGTVLFIASDDGEAHAIEGIWRSAYYCNCMCDSDNFFQFEDGRIVQYADQHLTDYAAGTYEKLDEGLYRVTLAMDSYPALVWEVRPGKRSWVAPPDEGTFWPRRWARRFYRPRSTTTEEHLIATAPERDARFEADRARNEANKSE